MKKETNGKKSLAWLWILLAILGLLAIAGGVLAFIFLGGSGEEEVVEPVKRTSALYWNVDRKEMIDPETGLSAREAAADGMYYLRLAVDGEQIEMPVADKKLVNRMDILDVFGIEFDAEGNAIDLIPVEEMYTKIGEKVFVQSIDGNTAILNTSQALNGMQIPITLTGNEDVFSVSTLDRPEFDGQRVELKVMDQVLVFGTDESTPHTFYVTDRFWESDVYWRTVRMWDSTNKFTSREKQPDGYWYFDMAAKGEIKTYRTNREDVIKAIDGYAVTAACCGLVFDENGDVIDCFNAAMAARGYVAASSWHITEIAEDGSSFTATRIMMGNDVGKTYTSTITADTEIYNVNTTADFVGQKTELQLNDCVYIIADTKGVAKRVFVIIRQVDSPMYYLLNRSFSSAKGMTAEPDADGFYNFTFAVKGKQVKLKSKDKKLAEQIHGYGMNMMGLKVSGNIVLKAYNPECVSGNYSFASGYFVQNFSDPLMSAQSTSGTAANGVLAAGCEIYDVSGVDRVKGKKATLREGDRVYCYTNPQGEVTHIYITSRYVAGTKLYWNLTSRSYDSTKFETKAEKNEEGYYTFKVIKPGKGEMELKTTSKEVASQFHAISSGVPIALKVSGTTVKAAYPGWAVVEGGGYYSLPNTTLTEETEDGGFKALTTTYIYGTLRLGADCQAYNIAGHKAYNKFRGEATTVRVGDRVYPLYSYQGSAKYVFVTVREQNTEVYYKYDRKYDSTKQETTREPVNGYYVYKVTVNGKVKEVKVPQNQKQLANYIDSYALGFGLKLSGNIVKGVYPAESAPEVYGGQVSYRDVTKISGKNITTKRNKPGQTDTGKVTEIELAANCLIVNVSPTAGDKWGKKDTLQRGDRIYTYKDNFGKTSIIYIMNECKRSDGGYAKCPECGKVVWWEPALSGFSMVSGYIPKTAHYYLEDDRDRTSNLNFADGDICKDGVPMKITLDLYGNTWTRAGTQSYDKETGEDLGLRATTGMIGVGSGNTLTIIDTKGGGGLKAAKDVQFTGSGVLMMASGDTKKKDNDPETPENETADQLESLGYDTAKYDEAGTLIIKAGTFDASQAVSIYKGANSGAVSVGGNLIVKGGKIVGIKSTATNYVATAAAIGTWGGSNVTISGGTVMGAPVAEGEIAGPTGAAIAANSSDGTIKITGGTIIGSNTSNGASAIFNRNGEMIITGGTIKGGIATESGKEIQISGKPVITSDYNGGIELRNGALLKVGKLETGADIFMNTVGLFTTDYASEAAAQADVDAKYFKAENPVGRMEKALGIGEYRCLYRHYTKEECAAANCNEPFYFWGAWTNSDSLPASASAYGAYYLDSHVNVTANTSVVGNLVLDLNGKTINRAITKPGDMTVYSVSINGSLRLCDGTENPGKIRAVPTDLENDAVKSSTGLISGSSKNDDGTSTIVIDRITVDASQIMDNYYVGSWKTAEDHLSTSEKEKLAKGEITALKDKNDKILCYLNASGVPILRTPINAGAVVTGGDMTINGATIMGYQHTQGNGTAIGSWGGANIVINEGSTIIGGSANAIGSKNLFGAEKDYSAISSLGQGGAIAMGKGTLTINGGEFKSYEGISATKHGALIMMNSSADPAHLTINGGTFYGSDVTARGGVVHASSTPTTITGGTFYAAKGDAGGILAGAGKTTITGGTFLGAEDGSIQPKSGGLIYYYGTDLSITGGTFKNGNDVNGGPNIYYSSTNGTLTIAGEADIAGEVIMYLKLTDKQLEEKEAHEYANTLVVGGKALVDYTRGEFSKNRNLRLGNVNVYLNEVSEDKLLTQVAYGSTVLHSLTYNCEGYVTGIITGSTPKYTAHEPDATGKCTMCGTQLEGEVRCVNGHTAAAECTAAACNGTIGFFQPWTETDSLPKTGNWYLTENVTLSAIQSTTGDLQLDLNGKNVTRTVPESVTTNTYAMYFSPGTTTIISDTNENPGTISVVYEGGVITGSTGVLSIGSPIKDKTTGDITTPAANVYLEKIIVDASNVDNCTYTGANGGAVANGGNLYIKDATIKGYKHTDGFGTAIGSWGGSYTEINGANTLIIGGSATNATSGKGEGGVIAANANWVINDGTFKTYDDAAASKHGGLIVMNSTAEMTINGGTFYGHTVTANGAVINHGKRPLTVNGGTFYAAKASMGGIFYGAGALTITGGEFFGTGDDTANQPNDGGLIYNNGANNVTISGGTFKNGNDVQGGPNIHYAGTGALIIIGDADIAGEVLVYNKSAVSNLVVGGKAIVDYTRGDFSKNRNIRVNNANIYLNSTSGELLKAAATGTKSYSLAYACDGVTVAGVVEGTTPTVGAHIYDATGKCVCGAQAEGESRCVNGHTTKTACDAAGCTAEIKFFRAWEETTSLPTSGAWFLTDNVTVEANAEVAGELTVDLKGKTITRKITKADNTGVWSVQPGEKLYLGDSAATAGAIVAAPEGLEVVKSTTGLISGSSPVDGAVSTITIDRITIDASAIKDNLYVGLWKTAESHLSTSEKTTAVALKDADDKTLVYLNKAGGVPLVRTPINAGAVVVGGELTINGATIKGYQHTQGNGTAIGTWGGGNVTINNGSVIIGGVANNVGSKALFNTENDFGAISNLGQGGVIAMGAGKLTINGGEIKAYEGATGTKHGGLIMHNGGTDARAALEVNGGTFYGPTTGTRGAVIHASAVPTTINGGTFYAGTANEGGVLAASGIVNITGGTFGAAEGTAPYAKANGGLIYYYGKNLTISGGTFNAIKTTNNGGILALTDAKYAATITGGTFNGVGNVDANKAKNGGLVFNKGTMTISGGTFQNGLDNNGGRNIYNAGTLTVGGDAKIAGEVLSWGTAEARAKITVTGKAVIDSKLSGEGMDRSFNVRLKYADLFINDATTAAKSTDSATVNVSLTYGADGNVNGLA